MPRSPWSAKLNRWLSDWLYDTAGNAQRLDTLHAQLTDLLETLDAAPPSAEQTRKVEDQIDYLSHTIDPQNAKQQHRLKQLRERWQTILDAPEERRLQTIETDIAALQEQVAANDENQQALLESLARIEQTLNETQPRNADQAERKKTLQRRLRDLIIGVVGAAGGALLGAAVQEEAVYPQLKEAVQRWLRLAEEAQAAEITSPLETPTAEPAPRPTPPEPAQTSTPEPETADTDLPTLIRIPAGNFMMGAEPATRQYLPTYHIAKTPTTVAQFAAFVRATGYRTYWEKQNDSWTWRTPRGEGSTIKGKSDHPVTNVYWDDAVAYCEWLSKRTGRSYRLPTRAEWEKAARGSDGRIYPWGNWPPNEQLCNFKKNVGDTTPVGRYRNGASPYGCLDMAGNVWEWDGRSAF
jgi:formylglycine-generating enzyme required for sulfatase activity